MAGQKKMKKQPKPRKESLPDVQHSAADIALGIQKAGVTGLTRRITINREGSTFHATVKFNIYLDVPPTRKGVDMSRLPETTTEVIEEEVIDAQKGTFYGLEHICEKMARDLLQKCVDYAKKCTVEAQAEISFPDVTPVTKKKTQRELTLLACIEATNDGELKVVRKLGVETYGFVACPCAQSLVSAHYHMDDGLLPATHNQRSRIRVTIDYGEQDIDLELLDLAEIIHSKIPPLYEVLKRPDELEIVKRAHMTPYFVEDIVRTIAVEIVKRFNQFSDSTVLSVRADNHESIHRHDATAELTTMFGEIRSQIK